MPYTFNGTGTAYYGKRDKEPDGSYITTEWFVLLYLPIFPRRSFRVLPKGNDKNYIFYASQGFYAREAPLNLKQVRNIYLGTYGIIGIIYLLVYILA